MDHILADDQIIANVKKARNMIGHVWGPSTYEIEKRWIRHFAEAIEDPNPLFYDEEYAKTTRFGGIVAPVGFPSALRQDDGGYWAKSALSELKMVNMNGGNELLYYLPIRPGDRITVTSKLVDVTVRDSSSGKMLFFNFEKHYKNQEGNTVTIGRNTLLMFLSILNKKKNGRKDSTKASNLVNSEPMTESYDIPSLVKRHTTKQLVKWANASDDFCEMHYDKNAASSRGLPAVIVHGWISFCTFGQMLQNWVGINGDIKKLKCTYRGMIFPDKEVTYKGEIVKKYRKDNENLVECDLWCEDNSGTIMTEGKAIVSTGIPA